MFKHVTMVRFASRVHSARLHSYIVLMKPHVTMLLLGVTLVAMAVAPGGLPPLGVVLSTLVGGAMAAGSANAINCYLRPRHRCGHGPHAGATAACQRAWTRSMRSSSACSWDHLVFCASARGKPAQRGARSCRDPLLRRRLYTLAQAARRRGNIVIGGAAGAVPVLVGWAAATDGLSLTPVLMFLIIFMWTPPHFWALSLVLKKDYAKAGVPMLPVVRGERATRRQIVVYSALLLPISLTLVATHAMGWLYLVCAVTLGLGLCAFAVRLAITHRMSHARDFFWLSNNYLALLFAAMALDKWIR